MKIKWISFNENTPAHGMWDQAFLGDILESIKKYKSDRLVVVIPGAGNKDKYDEINEYIAQFEKVLIIITSDEESLFDTDNIIHNDIIIYSQYPTDEKSHNVNFWLPIGYTPHIRPNLRKIGLPNKTLEWSFSGQITHTTREELYRQLSYLDGGMLLGTEGFTQGVSPEVYAKMLADSKVVPSPAGAVKPEAFRTYEALEAGAIPIPQGLDYHNKLFKNYILMFVKDWENIGGQIKVHADSYPNLHNHVLSWWIQEKRTIRNRFIQDLKLKVNPVTVLMSTSPVVTNPSTEVIEIVIDTIRKQLPDAEILIMCDGVRPEQSYLQDNYDEFLRKLLWKANLEWENITPIVYKDHLHQLEMTKQTLDKVNTELVLFVEHDMPFYDRPIDWKNTIKLVQSDKIKVMRYHFEAVIPEPHYYLMLDQEPITIDKVSLIRTAQWSQRPHLLKVETYRELLSKWTTANANCMIEDAIHGHIVDDVLEHDNWDKYRIAIYAPDLPTGFCFAYHIDGRQGEDKFEDKQVF